MGWVGLGKSWARGMAGDLAAFLGGSSLCWNGWRLGRLPRWQLSLNLFLWSSRPSSMFLAFLCSFLSFRALLTFPWGNSLEVGDCSNNGMRVAAEWIKQVLLRTPRCKLHIIFLVVPPKDHRFLLPSSFAFLEHHLLFLCFALIALWNRLLLLSLGYSFRVPRFLSSTDRIFGVLPHVSTHPHTVWVRGDSGKA